MSVGASEFLAEPDINVDSIELVSDEITARSPWQLFWRRFRADRIAMVSAGFIVLLILVALLAHPVVKLLGVSGPNQQNLNALDAFGQPTGPSSAHPLGVDELGRDILARVIYGAQVSLEVAFISTGFAVVIGVIVGTVAGFFRGWIDSLLGRLMDVVLAFPILLLAIGLASACSLGKGCLGGLITPGRVTLIVVIALSSWPYIGRIIRGQVLSLREKEFIDAARSLGASNRRIMAREILPNLVAPIIVYTSLILPTNILYEAALSFLGVGIQPPTASWGEMIASATPVFNTAWWYMLFPGLALVLTVLAFNLVGDGLRTHSIPRPGRRCSGAHVTHINKGEGTQMRLFRLTLVPPVAIACALVVAACGSSSSNNGSGSGSSSNSGSGLSLAGLANVKPVPGQHMGGTLNIISSEGWEHLDPAASYFQIDYLIVYATQSPLYIRTPTNDTPQPLVASGPPQISADGKTVTIHIKPDFKFGPPVNRAITSKDVAYAFQRDFNPNTQNAYASGYYPIVGAAQAKGKPIPGISTPNSTTIVFHLTKSFGRTFYESLTLPASSAIPAGYTAQADKSSPSKWDTDPTSQVFTGPYMIKSYQAGQSITLVRNPNWSRSVDGIRPAYADKIVWQAGADPTVAARQTLDSKNLLLPDTPPSSVLKTAYQTKKKQLTIGPLGDYYAALNTQVPPFNNVNLRKAVVAAANREAYLLARGGKLIGQVMNQYIYPEVPGFQQAGGFKGFGEDFLASPTGNMTVAKKYMKLAGYPSGKYTGNATVTIVGSNADPGPQEMQIVQSGLTALGFKTTIKGVPQQTMYSKFCGYVKAHVNVCPTAGWIEDYPDPYAALFVPFSGESIVPINNSNWSVLNDPKVNTAIDQAAAITDLTQRYQAFAKADKMIVDDAPAIPEIYSDNAELEGSQVHGVMDPWNDDWDLSFSSVS